MSRIFAVVIVLLHIVLAADSVKFAQSQQSLENILSDSGVKIDHSSTNATRHIYVSNPVTFSTQHKSFHHHTAVPQYDLHRMNADQLIWYFCALHYTEKDVLSQPMLYMRQPYLTVAKQLSRYPEFVEKYYKQYSAYSRLFKIWETIHFRYCKGLAKQFERLYQECEEQQLAQEAREQKQRELRAQQEREAQKKKEATERETYIRELERVERILSDTPARNRTRLEQIRIAQQKPERTLHQLQTGQEILDFAATYGITEQQITQVMMNSYEYRLHEEFVSHLHSARSLQQQYVLDDQNIFINALGNGITLGMKSNQLHNPEWATWWSNFCYEAKEIITGIGEGILLGSYNTVDMVMNPVSTLVHTVHGICMLGTLTARTVGTLMYWNHLIEHGEFLQYAIEVYSVGEQLVEIAVTIQKSTAKMSKRDIAKHVTAFGVDWALTGQMLTMGYKLCSNLGNTIKRTIKFLKDEGAAGELALATTDGMLLKASGNMNKGGGVNNLIRNTNTLLETVHAEYMARLEKELEALCLICDNKVKDVTRFGNKYLKPEYEHILGMDLYFSRRGVPKLGGFHHDLMHTVEKIDIFKFVDKVVHENGCYSAKVYYGEHLVKDGTFFPAHWSREQVIEKIYEAYNNFVKSGVKAEIESGKYYIKSATNEGIKIEMYITTNGHIKTAYPTL